MSPVARFFLGASVLVISHPAAPTGPERTPGVDENGDMMLKIPRRIGPREAICARITVGVLPRGARIIVRTADGKIAGTINPFGVPKGQKGGVQTIPIPARSVAGETVSLRLELQEKGTARARVPTRTEVESVKLDIIPITPDSGEGP